MRWSWVLPMVAAAAASAATTAATTASARPVESTPPRRRPPPDTNLWREIIEPHGDEVRALLRKARAAMRQPDTALVADTEWAVAQRTHFYRDAYHLLRHARRLAPENLEVLALLARAADQLGLSGQAVDALETSVRITGAEHATAQVTGLLGAIHLRRGDLDAAIRWLRLAQGPVTTTEHAHAAVHLATALAARNEVGAAIQTLANALPDATVPHYSDERTLVAFALAVLYDRDEQPGAAFEVLEHMRTLLQSELARHVQLELAKLHFAPAEDLHYYRGLLYETLGRYAEARAEWAHYAAIADAPWRGRALQHVAALDRQRRAARRAKPSRATAPAGTIPRKLPSP